MRNLSGIGRMWGEARVWGRYGVEWVWDGFMAVRGAGYRAGTG
jgi:hypothetical protein